MVQTRGRLSLGKGEGRVRVGSWQPTRLFRPIETPHLNPLPFFEGRGDKSTLVSVLDFQRLTNDVFSSEAKNLSNHAGAQC